MRREHSTRQNRGSGLPKLFIGSSTEGMDVAEALQAGLDKAADCTIWSQATVPLGRGLLESLVDSAPRFDFAALILTPDDVTTKRDVTGTTPRDNVLFELGLFIGTLGRDSTFMVSCADDELQLPSDLAGVLQARYRRRDDGNLTAALGPVCLQIKQAMALIQHAR